LKTAERTIGKKSRRLTDLKRRDNELPKSKRHSEGSIITASDIKSEKL
jgi:hypothetical protein